MERLYAKTPCFCAPDREVMTGADRKPKNLVSVPVIVRVEPPLRLRRQQDRTVLQRRIENVTHIPSSGLDGGVCSVWKRRIVGFYQGSSRWEQNERADGHQGR